MHFETYCCWCRDDLLVIKEQHQRRGSALFKKLFVKKHRPDKGTTLHIKAAQFLQVNNLHMYPPCIECPFEDHIPPNYQHFFLEATNSVILIFYKPSNKALQHCLPKVSNGFNLNFNL